MKKYLFFWLLATSLVAQSQIFPFIHPTERKKDIKDTTNLQHFFRNGEFYGHARYYFMATDNDRDLTDFFANAFGMGIGYETGKFKGFQVGISGFFIYNMYSSDFTKNDPRTGVGSRYEIGQFDMLNPTNRSDMDRLEDLYIKYSYKNNFLKFGKQHVRSPFINPQDGRMRPTLVEGAVFELNPYKFLKLEGGWISKISPRSTVSWFDIGQSMSIFPPGVDAQGRRSGYVSNVHSDAVYYAGIHIKPVENIHAQIWSQRIANVQHSNLFQLNTSHPLNTSSLELITGLQYIRQNAVNDGGNSDPKLAYVAKNNVAQTYGARLGARVNKKWHWHLNYNRITKGGRYLMPREWGRDPFFTFMPRERNEGYADVHAFMTSYGKTFGKSGWKAELSYGRFYLPDVRNFAHNKYGMPSYDQLNFDVRYNFQNFWKGLELQFLYVYKGKIGNHYGDDRYIINKVNMSLYNLVLNYHF